jgi:predicted DNA-binding transcriptional regulator YafY
MSTNSTLRLVSELVAGQTLGRETAAKVMGTNVAAADRQLRAIARALPVDSFKRRGVRLYKWKDRAHTTPPSVPVATVLAAYFGSSLGRLFEETIYGPGMRDAARTLTELSGRAERFENADRQFVFVRRGGEMALRDNERQLTELVQILLDSNMARFRYRAVNGRRRSFDVQPLSIAIYDHQLYVIAKRKDGTFHPFRFARIERVTRLPQRVPYPERNAYDPEQIFRESIGVYVDEQFPVRDIAVRLSPKWVQFAQTHRWHMSQTSVEGPAGKELRLRVRQCPELERWALGFGADAEVLRPPELRKKVAWEARRMVAMYEGDPSLGVAERRRGRRRTRGSAAR